MLLQRGRARESAEMWDRDATVNGMIGLQRGRARESAEIPFVWLWNVIVNNASTGPRS